MEAGVLGPVELVHEGVRVPLGGPKQRLVFGLLAAWRGRVVPVDELIDGLWPEGPQARPRKTVQVYVTRLRRALGDVADAIRSEAAGYRLDTSLLAVDADAFEAGVRAARADHDDDRATATLRAALEQWRGEAFVDLRDCPALVPSAVQLDERRLAAMYDLFEREVRRRPREVIAELEQAVEAYPLHEGFAAQLMTAQYRAGRQADALHTYQQLRRRLGEELGLDPGPEVRELQGRILRHELPVVPSTTPALPERQRRRVTVVAVELAVVPVGVGPLDPEDEMALALPVRRQAKARIVERGGVILGEAGEGLAACFGYPSTERSVERAVLAALAVRDLAAGADGRIAARIGVDTGVVVIEGHTDGGSDELTNIAGEPLRAAMRLRAAAAAGQVLVGPATADGVGDLVELAPTDPAAPAPAVVLGAKPTAGAEHTPRGDGLVGRETALAELAAIAGRAEARVCPVVVTGPAGIGKSAVAETFLSGLGDGWAVVRLFCDPRRSVTPLHPFRPVLPDVFAETPAPSPRAVMAALRDRWGVANPVLFVDDVESADPSTRELLDELPDQLASGLVLLTSRSPAPLELDEEVVARIALGPLDRAASRQVAAAIAADRRLRLDVLNEIADRSGGVPLHIVALTRAMLDGRDGVTTVPVSLYDSLMSVLDRLGPARALAQRLSVLGPSFDDDDLDVMAQGHDPTDVRAQLATIIDAGVVRVDESQYRFANALVAEAAYQSLLNADRVALHAGIAAAMPESVVRAAPERLAFHLEAAGRPFDAAVAYRRASSHAIGRARHREAQDHARRALRLLDQLGPDAQPDGGDTHRRALTNLAVGLQATHHGSDELLAVLNQARRRGVGRDDIGKRVLLDAMEISSLHERGEFLAATDVARASADATEHADRLSWAFAHQFLGATLVWRGDLREGCRELEQAALVWEDQGTPSVVGARAVGAMWSLLGLAARFGDEPDEAARLLTRARGVVPDEDGYGRCLVAATGAMADQLAGRPGAVRQAIEPVWSLAIDLSSDFWFNWAQALLGWAVAVDDAPTGLGLLAETVDESPTRQTMPYFGYLLGSRLCEHGRTKDGLGRLDDALGVADDTGELLWMPLLQLTKARWLDAIGDRAGATAAGGIAAAAATETGQRLIRRWHDEWEATRA